jgi:hypothetical protein
MEKYICDKAAILIIEHFQTCEDCQQGVGKLFSSYPFISTFVPGLKGKYLELLKHIEQKKKEALNG